MRVICDFDDVLVNRFKMALEISGESEQSVIEKAICTYTADTMAAESLRIQASVGAAASIVGRRAAASPAGDSKAATRLPLWARRPGQANHKMVRAFFASENQGMASKAVMEQFYLSDSGLSVDSFKQNFNSMCTDTGNAHGKVFESMGDNVQLEPSIQVLAQSLRANFYPAL